MPDPQTNSVVENGDAQASKPFLDSQSEKEEVDAITPEGVLSHNRFSTLSVQKGFGLLLRACLFAAAYVYIAGVKRQLDESDDEQYQDLLEQLHGLDPRWTTVFQGVSFVVNGAVNMYFGAPAVESAVRRLGLVFCCGEKTQIEKTSLSPQAYRAQEGLKLLLAIYFSFASTKLYTDMLGGGPVNYRVIQGSMLALHLHVIFNPLTMLFRQLQYQAVPYYCPQGQHVLRGIMDVLSEIEVQAVEMEAAESFHAIQRLNGKALPVLGDQSLSIKMKDWQKYIVQPYMLIGGFISILGYLFDAYDMTSASSFRDGKDIYHDAFDASAIFFFSALVLQYTLDVGVSMCLLFNISQLPLSPVERRHRVYGAIVGMGLFPVFARFVFNLHQQLGIIVPAVVGGLIGAWQGCTGLTLQMSMPAACRRLHPMLIGLTIAVVAFLAYMGSLVSRLSLVVNMVNASVPADVIQYGLDPHCNSFTMVFNGIPLTEIVFVFLAWCCCRGSGDENTVPSKLKGIIGDIDRSDLEKLVAVYQELCIHTHSDSPWAELRSRVAELLQQVAQADRFTPEAISILEDCGLEISVPVVQVQLSDGGTTPPPSTHSISASIFSANNDGGCPCWPTRSDRAFA